MELSQLKKDSAAIAAGQWVDAIPGLGEARLRVRGINSPVVMALRSRKERQVPRNLREPDGSIKPETQLQILREVLHEAVLLEWDGFTEDDKPLPYSKDAAGRYLLDPDFEAFADAVAWAARVVENGGAANREELEKNSGAPSSGN